MFELTSMPRPAKLYRVSPSLFDVLGLVLNRMLPLSGELGQIEAKCGQHLAMFSQLWPSVELSFADLLSSSDRLAPI